MLDIANWNLQPIRFLILDFSLASGVDFSAAEAFLRIQRLLQVKNVILVLCGCDSETAVGKALSNVDLFQHNDDLVRVFSTLNDALEVSAKPLPTDGS
jgi:SulP family sulfate permease